MNQQYGCFAVAIDGNVASVLIDNAPTNLMDRAMIAGLVELVEALETATELSVVVFRSTDPDFFIMHADVVGLSQVEPGPYEPVEEANIVALALQRLHRLPQVTIGVLDGYARGGGAEFYGSLDLRFASTRSVLAQPEVPLGILPGATGTVRLPLHVGRSKALDFILTGRDVTAAEACEAGWITHVVEGSELDSVVGDYVGRLARQPGPALRAAKRVVDASLDAIDAAAVIETNAMRELMCAGVHVEPMQRFLDAGGQTRAVEADELRW